MICKKCGSNQPNGAKFCSNCGSIIEVENEIKSKDQINSQPIEESVKKSHTATVQADSDAEVKEGNSTYQNVNPPKKATVSDKIKGKVKSFWNGLDLFCKIETVAIIIVVLLLFIALCIGKIFPIILSVLQLGGLIVALLLHKGCIKCNLNWLKYVILAVSILFTGLYFSSFSWFDGTRASDSGESITPYGVLECVEKDKDKVKNDFYTAGFSNIDQEPIEDLEITDKDKYGVVDAVSINGVTDFEGNQEYKSSSKVVIKYHAFKKIPVPLSSEEIKTMDAESVLKAFEDAGFFNLTTGEKYDLDPDVTTVEFESIISIDGTEDFEKGEKFSPNSDIEFVTHRLYEKYNLKVVIDFVPNLIFSKYDVKLEIDDHTEKLSHGKDAEFEYRLKQGDYTLTFTSAESSSVNGSVELELNGDTEACYTISCTSEKVNIETRYVENKSAVGENQAMIPSSASTCKYKDYKDIEKAFKNAGFTNIKTKILYDIFWGITPEGEVDSVTVGGKSSFNRGDVVAKDAEIVITYHMKEEDDPSKKQETTEKKNEETTKADDKVSYSTNTKSTVKNGNAGVYSYRNRGGSYYIYYIIDFDEGYVYYFCDGNGSETCDKIKIVSGNLNDVLIITYHDGSDTWSEGLHFKWKNQPDHLIMQDNDGFEWDFYTTNLSEALSLRNKKTIHNY